MSNQKTFYFAYGSNMSTPRLEQRVGVVRCHGRAWLDDYCHRFSKRGRDGTAKGNVEPAPGARVWGVVYELVRPQLDTLTTYEFGYRSVSIAVRLDHGSATVVSAASFEALEPVAGLEPSVDYLRHYIAGLREHDIPRTYHAALFAGLEHLLDEP